MEMDACVNSDSNEFRQPRARNKRIGVSTATHDKAQARPPILSYPWPFRWTKPGVQPQVETKYENQAENYNQNGKHFKREQNEKQMQNKRTNEKTNTTPLTGQDKNNTNFRKFSRIFANKRVFPHGLSLRFVFFGGNILSQQKLGNNAETKT